LSLRFKTVTETQQMIFNTENIDKFEDIIEILYIPKPVEAKIF